MAETDGHRDNMISLLHALKERYREEPKVYISGNIFLYYRDEAQERKSISPDVLVVFGIEKKRRRIYKLEDEGKAPDVVFELTSPTTKTEDLGTKRYIYASLGVREYFLFDPYAEALRPALRGYRLDGSEYMPMMGTPFRSEVLGVDLRVEDDELRLYDSQTGERLRTPEETEAEHRMEKAARRSAETARRIAEEKTAQELAARKAAETKAAAAEAELARLREELAALRLMKS